MNAARPIECETTSSSSDADVVIASGHSASGDYGLAQRAIVFADWPFVGQVAMKSDRGHSAR